MRRYGNANLLVGAAQLAAWALLITALHAPGSLWWKIPLAVLFCLMMQGVFSLMHECFHNQGHPSAMLNDALGALCGSIFGTAYTLFRVNHEGHHVRNRLPAELAEYVLPGESATRKIVTYYFAILGGIWLGSFVAALVLPFVPYRYAARLNRPARSMNGYSLSFAEFSAADWKRLRLESAIGLAIWTTAIVLLDWNWRVLVPLYVAFAFSWSSLQWVYHMRTPLDRVEGAYDLRAPRFVRWLFLNFNYNLTHHRYPRLPWQAMHEKVDPGETQPLWYRYLLVFKCPEPLPVDEALLRKTYF
ncbi:MAG: fatty acid desaturase family protein [Burkholderiales bacterium]